MFDNLSDKLQRVFKNLRGEGKLTAENMDGALREIRMALLEADVNFRVVKQLIENIKVKAMGEEVLSALSPSQQVIKIVHEELIKILGSHESKLRFANEPARHKILDIIGDLSLLGFDLHGHVVAFRSGHPLNVELGQKLAATIEQPCVLAREIGRAHV